MGNAANGIPFKVGVWLGPDGRGVIAALDPGGYAAKVTQDLSKNESWLTRINNTGAQSGAFVDYHYYGTGDRGGAPDEKSVEWIETAMHSDGPIHVVSSKADKMLKDITPEQRAKLPVYQGELLLTNHSAGSVTSQAYMKRWNRKNELLADAAERASVAAMWLGDAPYPAQKLYNAWDLLLGSQMHDMLPGTSVPMAYQFCWSDECLAANQFAAVTTDAVGAVAKAMDTSAQGVPVVVYNPLSIEREDVVEATVNLPQQDFHGWGVQVLGPDGKEVPSQIVPRLHSKTTETYNPAENVKIQFLAKVPPVGFATYDVRPNVKAKRSTAARSTPPSSRLQPRDKPSSRLRVTINDAGEISSIFDKRANREVLESPVRLAFLYENPSQYPAWNMDWDDRKNPPRSYVTGATKIEIVESGPARSTIQVTREAEGSKIVQRISLCGADGDRVEVRNKIDWQTRERSFKASIPFTIANPLATYDIAVGTMQRGNNEEKKFEVPQHQWFDLTAPDNSYGAAVINDSKYGSDKPDDHTMRLTLLYTPGTRAGYHDQGTQDFGRHDITYAIVPHAGDWRKANVPWIAARVNQPLMSFVASKHEGALGKTFSLASVSSNQVAIQAIKKAEDSDEIIVRVKEITGQPAQNVHITLGPGILSAREVDGQERQLADAKVEDGALVADIEPYRLRAFALKVKENAAKAEAVKSTPVALAYDLDAISLPSNRADGAFDEDGRTYPSDQIPATITSEGIDFKMGPTADGAKNAVVAKGQSIPLPANTRRIYLLASCIKGDQPAGFMVGQTAMTLDIQDWSGFIGQWDVRHWAGDVPETAGQIEFPCDGLTPGYVRPATVAWFSSHRHLPGAKQPKLTTETNQSAANATAQHEQGSNDFYRYSYLFKYALDVPAGATTLTLPNNTNVRIFAITAVTNAHDGATPARPLFDTLADHTTTDGPTFSPAPGTYSDATAVTINHPLYWQAGKIHYTTDGSAPTENSPVYAAPFLLAHSATVRAKEFFGTTPQEASAKFEVNDTTPPSVRSIAAMSVLPTVTVAFSEPLAKQSAEDSGNYRFEPAAEVKSAKLSDDGQSVALTLAAPLAANSNLSVTGVKDISGNASDVKSHPIEVHTPIYSARRLRRRLAAQGRKTRRGSPCTPSDSWIDERLREDA